MLAGRYRLDESLASGGMAQVWRGTDEVLRRAVAIKILHPHLSADETFVARFRQEAIAVAKLSHPAIVSVYDTCNQDGIEAIVMELVTGSTLRQRLDAGPIEPQIAANVAAQVACALEVAHGAVLVHRDIKPANIMVNDEGQVKVADFGIARAVNAETVTQTAAVFGTAAYIAPEQAQGETVDRRTDIYSLGCVLYEMLTGQQPFKADSAVALAYQHVSVKLDGARRLAVVTVPGPMNAAAKG
jgi:serine/threonine-protein kinase